MDLFGVFKVGASGLKIHRMRMDLIAANVANMETTRTPQGGPYRRKDLLVAAVPFSGRRDFGGIIEAAFEVEEPGTIPYGAVPVAVVSDPRPFKVIYEPGHPDANSKGYVRLPNINPTEEMVNLLTALRAYEANVAVINNARSMITKAFDIAR
ncbi:flagellar basal body rod protein FlgC [archaeon]|nr:MAG: flagellar basal body rod protein FlgC [archaeon]